MGGNVAYENAGRLFSIAVWDKNVWKLCITLCNLVLIKAYCIFVSVILDRAQCNTMHCVVMWLMLKQLEEDAYPALEERI